MRHTDLLKKHVHRYFDARQNIPHLHYYHDYSTVRARIVFWPLGLAIGVPIALSSTRILNSQLYELSPLDPMAIFIAIAVLSVMTIATAWLPARRATKIDPMQALRTE